MNNIMHKVQWLSNISPLQEISLTNVHQKKKLLEHIDLFFNKTMLSRYVFYKLVAVSNIKIGGFKLNDPSFEVNIATPAISRSRKLLNNPQC